MHILNNKKCNKKRSETTKNGNNQLKIVSWQITRRQRQKEIIKNSIKHQKI